MKDRFNQIIGIFMGPGQPSCSRRRFLNRAIRLGAGSALLPWAEQVRLWAAASQPATQPGSVPADSLVGASDWFIQKDKSRVAHLRAIEAVDDFNLLGELFEEGLRVITNQPSPGDAWHKILDRDDIVGIKFNHVGFEALGTTLPLAIQLVESLKRADFPPERIVLIEVPHHLCRQLKTRPCPFGYSGKAVDFGSGQEELVAVLQEVTAIINVPFLKTHNIAGMTGCLKNLSHALVRRPGLYHANGCDPFIGDILNIPLIRDKLRLHVVNALRAVFNGGPQILPEYRWTHGGLIVSRDPVAADMVGLDILNNRRAEAGLPLIGQGYRVPYIRHAATLGLGTDDQDRIELIDSERIF